MSIRHPGLLNKASGMRNKASTTLNSDQKQVANTVCKDMLTDKRQFMTQMTSLDFQKATCEQSPI